MKRFTRWSSRLFPRCPERALYASWLPAKAGAVLGITQYQDGLLIACEGGVWRLQSSLYRNAVIIEQIIQ